VSTTGAKRCHFYAYASTNNNITMPESNSNSYFNPNGPAMATNFMTTDKSNHWFYGKVVDMVKIFLLP